MQLKQAFDPKELDKLAVGEAVSNKIGEHHRRVIVRRDQDRAQITMEESGGSRTTFSCPWGDANLLALCIATGIFGFAFLNRRELEFLRGPNGHVRHEFDLSRRTLEIVSIGNRMVSIVVRGQSVPGGKVSIKCGVSEINSLGYTLLTGTFM